MRLAHRYGIIDRAGKEILPPQYDSVERARVSYQSKDRIADFFVVSQGKKKGVVRADGSWPLPLADYGSIHFYKEGDFKFDGSFWIDGRIYNPPSGHKISYIIRDAGAFIIEEVAGASESVPKKGVMLKNGEILIKPRYDEIKFVTGQEKRWTASRVDEDIRDKLIKAVVTGGDIDIDDKKDMLTFWLLDANGNEIKKFRARYHPFVKDGRVTYESGGKEYEINPVNGDRLIRDASRKAGSSYVLFQERGFWGLKHSDGQVLVEPQYVSMDSLGGDLFFARKIEGLDTGGKAPEYNVYAENIGVVNAANQIIMPFEYRTIESLRYPDRQTAFFMVGKTIPAEGSRHGEIRYGIADRSGRMIVPLQYGSHFYVNSIGQAQVYLDGRHGVIDHTGKVILPPVYGSIFDTASLDKTTAVFYIAEKDKLWGVYDATGKEIVPHRYGFIFIEEENIKKGWVTGDGPDRRKRGAYNYLTRVDIPAIYDGVRIYDHLVVTYRRSKGRDSRDEYDLLDLQGKKRVTCHRVESLSSGRFIAGKDELNGVLDPKGKVLVPLKYRSLRKAEKGFLWTEDEQGNDVIISETGEEYRIRD